MPFNILYEDAHLIVCKKEAGIPVQSARVGTRDMVSMLKNYLFQKNPGKEPYVGLVHRLDQPVSGVMVFAKTPFAAAALSKQLADGTMHKFYRAAVYTCGKPFEKEGTLVDYLAKDGRTNTSRVVQEGSRDAKLSKLEYRILRTRGDLSEADIHLLTGRHHQIRVQMAAHGMPLYGDVKYNTLEVDKSQWRQAALCAYRLEFVHPKTKKPMCMEIKPETDVFFVR